MTDNYECAIGPNVPKQDATTGKPVTVATKITTVKQPTEIKPLDVGPVKNRVNVAVVEELTGQDNTIQLLGKLADRERELVNLRCQLNLSNKQLDMEREEFHEYSVDLKVKLKAAEKRIDTLEAEKLRQNKDRDSYLSVVEILHYTQAELEAVRTVGRDLTDELKVVRHALASATKTNDELQQTVTANAFAHNETKKQLNATQILAESLSSELQNIIACKQEVEAEAVLLDDAVTQQKEKRLKEKEGHDIVIKYLILNIEELRETKQRLREKVAKLRQKLEDDEMPPLIQASSSSLYGLLPK